MKVAVVGGGLAGLAAGLELAGSGDEVVVLEARPTLGGAVQTLPERTGDPDPPPDNGQHIALGCFSAYLRFLAEIGEGSSVGRRPLSLPVIGDGGAVACIEPGALALARYRHLPLRDRVAVGRIARRLARLPAGEHDGETFAALLRRLGQSEVAIEHFWDVFIRPALNLRSDEVSAAAALFTVQTALLGARGAADLVLPRAPLGAMHGDAAGRALAARGAAVRTGARVLELADGAAVLADGAHVEADGFVVAVPPAESARLLGEEAPRLDDSPIVSAHFLFDRPLLRHDLAALLGSAAHWVFDRGRLTGREPSRGQYLTVVSSGAPELLQVRGRGLVELLAGELTDRLGRAELLWSRVSREPAATFAARPGTAALRPGPKTGRPNVARAGAWTATGWPATMEGAVRSGVAAARFLQAAARERVIA
ncbi:MAG TPA: hydroxysqualene dehydroxylase HpnE [Gaiellaceae bacterium]|nr:hydroxysqualene dehydroxylase HpnE [Gaiellaceae bacterium]